MSISAGTKRPKSAGKPVRLPAGIREERLKDEQALQTYFTNRIAAYLDSKGRRAMGWNEILQAGLAKSAVVQFWVRGRAELLHAVRNDQRAVVMSPFWIPTWTTATA